LDRIPNRDLRLFAQIELIAGAKGLPQFGGLSIPPRGLTLNKRDRWVMWLLWLQGKIRFFRFYRPV
jgi:hypothetical protein